MKRMTSAQVGAFILTITSSGFALANCPGSMPVQLQEDCIVVEGSGSSFPNSTYANMDQYQDWLKSQQPQQPQQPHALAKSKIK
jgi:hypothetical protein